MRITGVDEIDELSLRALQQLPVACIEQAPMNRLVICQWTELAEHPLFNWEYQAIVYFGDLGLYRCTDIIAAYVPHPRIGPPQ